MKNDYDKLKDLLKEFGIPYRAEEEHDSVNLEIHAKDGDGDNKNEGYTGFHTIFKFDGNGKFISVGVWE